MKKPLGGSDRGADIANIVAQIRHLLDLEYKRGANESLQSVASLLGKGDLRAEERVGTRVRRGAAKTFVEKILTDEPKSIAEIRSMAKTPEEQMLSYQTLRLELLRGRKNKRYKKSPGGKWSI